MNQQYDIPVVLFIFRRLESVRLIMETLQKLQPAKLYIFSDGARDGNLQEQKQVEDVRDYVASAVNWNVEFKFECAQHKFYW